MHLVRTLPLALLALAGAVTADDYDYIRGDDIYSEDYNYGLNYDRLRSDESWCAVPALVVLPGACVSLKPLPADDWDRPFQGWVCEGGFQPSDC